MLAALPGVLNLKLNDGPMIRIIDGVAYEGKRSDSYKLRAFDCGHGHLEFSASSMTQWTELEWTKGQIDDHLEMIRADAEERADEIARQHAERGARSAKSRVRRLCKSLGADTLLTLTYRACVTDLAECKRDLKEWVRRVRRVLPDFRAVAAFERQTRGAWHVHLATVRLPASLQNRDGVKVKSFPLLLSIWRSVTGDKGGSFNARSRKRNSQRSPARIASYLSKYIIKAFNEGEKWSNRWTRFGDCETPAPIDLGITSNLLQAITDFYALAGDSVQVVNAAVSRWKDWVFCAFEPPPRAPCC